MHMIEIMNGGRKNKTTIIIIVAIVVFLVVIGVSIGLAVYFTNKNSSHVYSNSNTSCNLYSDCESIEKTNYYGTILKKNSS